MFKWKKKGKIFAPNLIGPDNTYSQVPFAVQLDNILRIYFTSRPPKGPEGTYVSYVYYADFDIDEPSKLMYVEKHSLLKLGSTGTFDEYGTMPCSIIPVNTELWMYYVGWTRMHSVPYNFANGLAISKDSGKTFEKYSQGPIMGQGSENPFIVGCPRVYIFNNTFYMWYLSGTGWIKDNNRSESVYHLKLAISVDGIKWDTINHNVMTSLYENECQTCAAVFEYQGKYHMYFTYRHTLDFRNPERGYRIGYGYSDDLINWTRDDSAGNINLSEQGWDSEMICYPFVINVKNKHLMFYCGNQFGLNGFGYAVLEE